MKDFLFPGSRGARFDVLSSLAPVVLIHLMLSVRPDPAPVTLRQSSPGQSPHPWAYPSWRSNWKFLERVQQGRTFCRLAFSSPCISRNPLSILENAGSKDRARRGLPSLGTSAAKGKNLYTKSRFRCSIARSGVAYRKTLYRKNLLPGKMIRTRRMFTVSVIAS